MSTNAVNHQYIKDAIEQIIRRYKCPHRLIKNLLMQIDAGGYINGFNINQHEKRLHITYKDVHGKIVSLTFKN